MNDIVYVAKHFHSYDVSQHFHESWELVYCTDGNGVFTFQDETKIEYGMGDIVIIPPNVLHNNHSDVGFTNIHMNICNATLPQKKPVLISDDNEHRIERTFYDAFYYYYNSTLKKRQLIVSSLGDLIVNYIIAFQSNKPLSPIVEKIKSNILNSFPDCNYSLENYLRSLPFNYDYLRKVFQNEMGLTPHGFLTNTRMQTAAKMLASSYQTEYNISMIAQICGYEEPLYFSRVFKKYFGCSPREYAAISKNPSAE